MNSVLVRNIRIGEGRPKICVPVLGKTEKEILEMTRQVKEMSIDLIEWRADWYEDVFDCEKIETVLLQMRAILGDTPILFTFRTAKEGGNKEVDSEQYIEISKRVCDMRVADMIDVEMFSGENVITEIIDYAHKGNIVVVGSNHDFNKTPSKKEIIRRLQFMQHFQADILKIAVMPISKEDVITLLLATQDMVTKYAERPVVTISMSKLGVLSRVSGELFGSAITFASADIASAPGQIPVEAMKYVLELLRSE